MISVCVAFDKRRVFHIFFNVPMSPDAMLLNDSTLPNDCRLRIFLRYFSKYNCCSGNLIVAQLTRYLALCLFTYLFVNNNCIYQLRCTMASFCVIILNSGGTGVAGRPILDHTFLLLPNFSSAETREVILQVQRKKMSWPPPGISSHKKLEPPLVSRI